MADEIMDAVQIIRVAYDGIEIAMKTGSGGIDVIKNALKLIKGMLDYEKSIGKTSMRKLLLRGGDLQVMEFQKNEADKFKKLAKKYGLLYSEMPSVNKDKTEILFHSEATPRANVIAQKLNAARVRGFDEFVKENGADNNNKLVEFLEKQKSGNFKSPTEADSVIDDLIDKAGRYALDNENISVENITDTFLIDKEEAGEILKRLETIGIIGKADENGVHEVIMDRESYEKRMNGYRQLAERMKAISMSKNTNLSDITISKTLIADENDRAVKTRVPGTWGKNVRYLWSDKEDILDIYNGKTMLTFLDKKTDYVLYDEHNKPVDTISGEKLYTEHYDSVNASIRERFEGKNNIKQTPVHTSSSKAKRR